MKKLALIISIIGISLLFVGCNKQDNSKNNDQYKLCRDNKGNPESRFNGSGKLDVCYFDDESFCFLDDLKNGKCEKGDHYYEDEEYYNEAFEEFNENDNLETDEEINDDNIKKEIAECDEKGEDIICGKDGNTYYNRCYLEFAGVEEETELAEIVDGKCIFG